MLELGSGLVVSKLTQRTLSFAVVILRVREEEWKRREEDKLVLRSFHRLHKVYFFHLPVVRRSNRHRRRMSIIYSLVLLDISVPNIKLRRRMSVDRRSSSTFI